MYLQNRKRLTDLENELMVAGRKRKGKGQLGSLGCVPNAVYKTGNQPGPTVQYRELCSVLHGSLDGRGVWGRMDPCMCMAESLCCSPKTTVLIGYTPIQNNKKVQKKRKIWCPSSFIVFLHTHTQKEENIKIVFKTARYFRDIFKLKKKNQYHSSFNCLLDLSDLLNF